MNLYLEIITPEKIVFKDNIDEVIAPTLNGQIAILPNHTSLLTQIENGELIIKKGKDEQYLAVAGGFLEVNKNKITVLANYAIHSKDIQVTKALEAQKRAEKLMKEKVSEKDFAEIQTQLQRSILELKVAERRKRRPI